MGERLMAAHSLIKRSQEVLIELLLRILIKLVILLQEGLLWADLV